MHVSSKVKHPLNVLKKIPFSGHNSHTRLPTGLKFQPWVRADVIYVICETSYFDSLENYGNYGHSYKKLDDTEDRAFERNIYRFKKCSITQPIISKSL